MTKNSSLLTKSKVDKSVFSGQTIPDSYQSLNGLTNTKAVASYDRSGLAGSIPTPPPPTTTSTTTTTTTAA